MEKTTVCADLVYKEINIEDIEEIASFLNRVFNVRKFTLKYLKNIYFECNSVIGYNVFRGSKIIAHYCVLKRSYVHLSTQYTIGWSVNTAVDKEFRGKGFFEDLATRTYNLARERGVVGIVGVANRKSTRLFLEKLGFEDKGVVSWNLDIIVIYSVRRTRPIDLNHLYKKTLRFRSNIYLLLYPLVKVYSERDISLMSIYLTNRKKKCGVGITLPQNWFKSNWQVITLNLLPSDNGVSNFLKDFSIDIAESDTF